VPLGLTEMLDGLAAMNLPEPELQQQLDDAAASMEAILDVELVGLMLPCDHGPPFVGASQEAGRALERAQVRLGEGPGLDAMRGRDVVAAEDLEREDRWPNLRTDPAAKPVNALLSAPIWLRARPTGNLNLFAQSARTWSSADRRALTIVAGVLGTYLDIVLSAHESDRIVSLLTDAGEQEDGT
jgi:GAF domain-containing protein